MKKISVVLAAFAFFLRVCCAQETSVAVPEAGFISPDKYTNAFFGFSLPLPQDSAFRAFQLPSNGPSHRVTSAEERAHRVYHRSYADERRIMRTGAEGCI
jgi:hypothetical protein